MPTNSDPPGYGDDDYVAPDPSGSYPSGGGTSSGGATTSGAASGNCPPPDCYAKCRADDIEQQKKCKVLNEEFQEKMKAEGCPGTKCKTRSFAKSCRKPKRCARRKTTCCKKKKKKKCGC